MSLARLKTGWVCGFFTSLLNVVYISIPLAVWQIDRILIPPPMPNEKERDSFSEILLVIFVVQSNCRRQCGWTSILFLTCRFQWSGSAKSRRPRILMICLMISFTIYIYIYDDINKVIRLTGGNFQPSWFPWETKKYDVTDPVEFNELMSLLASERDRILAIHLAPACGIPMGLDALTGLDKIRTETADLVYAAISEIMCFA